MQQPPPPSGRRRQALPLVLAVVVVLLLAAGGAAAVYLVTDDDPAPRRAAPSTSSTLASAAPTTVAENDDEPAYIAEIRDQVSEVRGLPWKSRLKVDVVSKAELQRRVREVVARDARPDRLAGDEATLKLLHLIPQNLDYVKAIDDLLAEQVLGFYDPETKELVVAAEEGEVTAATKISIAHELNHALTDQHFDFGSATEVLDDGDLQEELFAYAGLIEGDAVTLQFRWAEKYLTEEEQVEAFLGGGEGADTSVLERTPPFISESLLFPYTAGALFVSAISGDGFARVDKAYREPPRSTEQVMHPELYVPGTGSTAPALPDIAAVTGCEPVRRNTVGEFAMAQVLAEELDEDRSDEAAAGWSGDVFETVRCDGSLGLVDRWRADREADAVELERALREWAGRWSGSNEQPAADGNFAGPDGSGRVTRSGSQVDLVIADDTATSDRLESAIGPIS